MTKKPITAGLPYEVVPAAYPHDSWALGAVMYELCAGIKLFLQDDEDNIDPESMQDLYNFTDDFKQKKMAKIADPQARNLVSQLLSRDPRKRPNFHQVSFHDESLLRWCNHLIFFRCWPIHFCLAKKHLA